MANQILNFREETMNMQKNIQEIEECAEQIKMVNDMRGCFTELRNKIVCSAVSLAFWIFGFIVYFTSCTLQVRIVAVAAGALATLIIFKIAGGKVSAVAIASVAVCYFIIKGILDAVGADLATMERIIMFVPVLILIINTADTFFTYEHFKNSANRIMPQ